LPHSKIIWNLYNTMIICSMSLCQAPADVLQISVGQFDCWEISSREFLQLFWPGPQLLVVRWYQAVH
jgi:hypothetical protein